MNIIIAKLHIREAKQKFTIPKLGSLKQMVLY